MNRHFFIPSVITVLFSAFSVTAAEPEDLTSLRESFQRARRAALDPLEKKYLEALSDIKTRYTKAGNLEAALAVDAEIKSLQSPTPAVETTKMEPTKDDSAVILDISGTNHLRFVKGPFTFKEAEAVAASMGGKLAVIQSSKEMKEISDAMAKVFGNDFPHSWVGLLRTQDGAWTAADGTELKDSITVEYGDAKKYPKNNGAIIRFGKITATDSMRTSPGAIVDLEP